MPLHLAGAAFGLERSTTGMARGAALLAFAAPIALAFYLTEYADKRVPA